MSHRKRSSQEKALHQNEALVQLFQDIAVAANESSTLEEATQITVDRICTLTSWPVGHVYVLAPNDPKLLLSTKIWHLADPKKYAEFRGITEETTLPKGAGLPGRVLASGEATWIRDVGEDQNFPRAKHANEIGVKGAFAFPVKVEQEVVAVLEFFCPSASDPDPNFLEVMVDIGKLLTRVVERQRSEQALRKSVGELEHSRKQLRALSAHLLYVREEERTKISREIHDELGQVLTGLKMDLSWLDNRLMRKEQLNTELLLQKTSAMSKLIDLTIQIVRKISSELRPGVLDDLGLVEAIDWQCHEFESRTGIHCIFHSESEHVETNPNMASTMFRILQETLTNVARHAHASRVDVTLNMLQNEFQLVILDNGKGITEEEIADPEALGILGMRERAFMIGGNLEIQGSDGEGTLVTATIPAQSETGESSEKL